MGSRMRRVKLAMPTKMDELQIKELPIYLSQFSLFLLVSISFPIEWACCCFLLRYIFVLLFSVFYSWPWIFLLLSCIVTVHIFLQVPVITALTSFFQAGHQVGLLESIQCLCCCSVLLDCGFSRENTVSVLGFGKRADNGSTCNP